MQVTVNESETRVCASFLAATSGRSGDRRQLALLMHVRMSLAVAIAEPL